VHGLSEGSCATAFLVGHPRHQNSNGPMFLIIARMCFRCSPFAVSQSRPAQPMGPLPARGGARIWHRESELIASVLVNTILLDRSSRNDFQQSRTFENAMLGRATPDPHCPEKLRCLRGEPIAISRASMSEMKCHMQVQECGGQTSPHPGTAKIRSKLRIFEKEHAHETLKR
jgi:hypothetical protein